MITNSWFLCEVGLELDEYTLLQISEILFCAFNQSQNLFIQTEVNPLYDISDPKDQEWLKTKEISHFIERYVVDVGRIGLKMQVGFFKIMGSN